MGVWACGRVGVWACGRVGVWACGRVGVWACGRVGVWACGRVGVLAKGRKGAPAIGRNGDRSPTLVGRGSGLDSKVSQGASRSPRLSRIRPIGRQADPTVSHPKTRSTSPGRDSAA